jgi:hypothetical protein
MNSVSYDRTSGTIDVHVSDPVDRSEYVILDASDKILLQGCIFGKVRKTCLYIGELSIGNYFIQVNGVRMDFQVIGG